MRQLNFKSYFTFLGRNKLYTAINFFGLSVSLAMIVLISTYTLRQLGTDSQHENADRIYMVSDGVSDANGYYLPKYLLGRYPEIEAAASVAFGTEEIDVSNNREKIFAKVLSADSTFFRIFTCPAVDGDVAEFATDRRNAVISESFARKLFGGSISPLGQPLRIEGESVDYVISAVMRDIDNSVLPSADVVLRAERLPEINPANNETMNNAGSAVTFLLAGRNADLASRADDMLEYFKEIYWTYRGGRCDRVVLIPLREIYFSGTDSSTLNRGNRDFVAILFSVAFVLLLFAVINYVNLTMAQTGFRAKEMATRRLLGASRGEIVFKLILESVFFSAAAFVLGLFLADAVNPLACRLLYYDFTVWSEFTPLYVAGCVLFVAAVGVVSGVAPAIAISRYKPVDVVKGSYRSRTKQVYSKIFIAVQNAVTVVMLTSALTMYLQIRHMINMPLGYDVDNVLVVDNNFPGASRVASFVEELRRAPQVVSVGVGDGTPLWGTNNNTIWCGEQRMVSFQQILGDSAYFDIFGFKVKRDNHTSGDDWFFNEHTFREMEFDEDVEALPLGRSGDYRMTVGGVYEDFRMFHSLREQSAAMIFRHEAWPYDKRMPWNTIVKTTGDHRAAKEAVKAAWLKIVPDGAWNGDGCTYMTDYIEELYAEQDRLLSIVSIFTALAVLVSALGLLAISIYYILQKRQEIAIRKVFGSTRREIVERLVGPFLALVAAGGVVAVPISWQIMNTWLESYSYRIGLHWWIFAAAMAAALLFSALTVLWHSVRAADENPVNAVKG